MRQCDKKNTAIFYLKMSEKQNDFYLIKYVNKLATKSSFDKEQIKNVAWLLF